MGEQQKAEGVEGQAAGTFEAELHKLEDAVRRIEEGNLSLEESLRLWEEATEAYRRCRQIIEEAELRVSRLVQGLDGELKAEPFEAPGQ